MRNAHLIYNPASGTRKPQKWISSVQERLLTGGVETELHISDYAGAIPTIVKNLPLHDIDSLVVVGGDGTIHEVINGLFLREDGITKPLGIIPAGTGNSLMHDLNCTSIEESIQKILGGEATPLDVMEVRYDGWTHYAFNVLAWGVPADVNILANKLTFFGQHRYNMASLIEICRNKKRTVSFRTDDFQYNGDLSFLVASNTIHTGKGMRIAPRAVINDGLIDLLFIKKVSRIKLMKLFKKVFTGTHINDPDVHHVKTKSLEITTPQPDPIVMDGEVKGHTPLFIELIPEAIQVYY